MRYWIWQLAM